MKAVVEAVCVSRGSGWHCRWVGHAGGVSEGRTCRQPGYTAATRPFTTTPTHKHSAHLDPRVHSKPAGRGEPVRRVPRQHHAPARGLERGRDLRAHAPGARLADLKPRVRSDVRWTPAAAFYGAVAAAAARALARAGKRPRRGGEQLGDARRREVGGGLQRREERDLRHELARAQVVGDDDADHLQDRERWRGGVRRWRLLAAPVGHAPCALPPPYAYSIHPPT